MVGHHGLVVNQYGREVGTTFELHARVQAGCEYAIRIRQPTARQIDRAGRRIDLVVD